MKKKIALILLVGFITMFPIRAFAMVELDDNGNPITKDLKEGEVTILMEEGSTAPDEGQGSDETAVTSSPEDSVTSSDETVKTDDNANSTDKGIDAERVEKQTSINGGILYTAQAEDSLVSANESDKNNINWIYIAISGIAGVALGGTITYIIKK